MKNFDCKWKFLVVREKILAVSEKNFSCDSLSPSFCNLTDLGIGTLANFSIFRYLFLTFDYLIDSSWLNMFHFE